MPVSSKPKASSRKSSKKKVSVKKKTATKKTVRKTAVKKRLKKKPVSTKKVVSQNLPEGATISEIGEKVEVLQKNEHSFSRKEINEDHEDHSQLAEELLMTEPDLLDEDDMDSLSDGGALEFSLEENDEEDLRSGKKKKKKSSSKIDKELTAIYKNADGSMPDMKHFQGKPRWRLVKAFFTFIITLIILGGVAYAGFFIFQPQARFSESDVILSISGDEEVQIGQEVHYRIRYRNAQNVPLTQTNIQVRYPDGFVFSESSQLSSNDDHTEWELGALDEHDSGYIDIYGTMFGDLDGERSFRVFLNYTPSNFSSEFQKVANATVRLSDAPVSLIIDGASDVVAGAETTIIFDIAPVEDVELSDISLVLEFGEQFVVANSKPEPNEFNKYEWTFDSLGDKQTIEVTGIFSASEIPEELVIVVAKVVGNIDGEDFVYTTETYEVIVAEADLSASLAINGSLHSFTVQPGEVLNTSIRIKNNGSVDLERMRVRAIFEAPSIGGKSILFWSDLTDDLNGGIFGEQLSDTVRRGTITWNQSNLRDLNLVVTGDEVTIDLSLPIKTNEEVDLSTIESYEATVILEIQYESGGEQQLFTSTPLVMIINSDLDLEVRDNVSSLADGESLHSISWILTNSFHDLKDISLTADVYGDVSIDTETFGLPAGEVEYDEEAKKVTWTIGTMPTDVDVLAFQIPIILNTDNPSQTNLTSQVTLTATDTVTGQQIIAVGDEILLRVSEPEFNE